MIYFKQAVPYIYIYIPVYKIILIKQKYYFTSISQKISDGRFYAGNTDCLGILIFFSPVVSTNLLFMKAVESDKTVTQSYDSPLCVERKTIMSCCHYSYNGQYTALGYN